VVTREVKLKIPGTKIRIRGNLETSDGRVYFKGFPYNPKLNAEIKMMEGWKWDKDKKLWSIKDCERNDFRLAVMNKENPYALFDVELKPLDRERVRFPLYEHQWEMLAHILTRRTAIFACEMGTGKTLVFIAAVEYLGLTDDEVIYVGPKSGVKAVGRELEKWEANFRPTMVTYEGLKKLLRTWEPGKAAPKFVCYDESSKLKNPNSQRSKAAYALAAAIRKEHGLDGYVLEMSGTPAPKSPSDWWHQCEVAQPGFLREGNIAVFERRMALTEERESAYGGVYNHRLTWLDDEKKCGVCGDYKTSHPRQDHKYQPSKNEVANLYGRMKGLVLVKHKSECLDLPEKRYVEIKVKPTIEMIRACKLIQAKAPRAITALSLMREISDGFQYREVKGDMVVCPNCRGFGTDVVPVPGAPVDTLAPNTSLPEFTNVEMSCDNCGGTGEVRKYIRGTDEVGSPKDAALLELMEDHEEHGRLIVWAGFTASLDRLTRLAQQQGWHTLKVDGRGYKAENPHGDVQDAEQYLSAMDLSHKRYKELYERIPKLCFIGQPKAGGMALTLTASPSEVFYSNVFDGEARMQAEDRGHRLGMDVERGLTIYDFIMLPTDKLVLDNLKQKKKLQNLAMNKLHDAFVSGLRED
jgi:SNF2 family DNA or RNA helicase